MKKALLTLVAIAATAVGASAQGLTATLQQGDKMTPFYGPDAFAEAYKAAQNGAVITLSAGQFNTVDSITKQVTIIGNGCQTHDGTESTYIASRKIKHYGSEQWTSLIIKANNVKVEGVCTYYVYLRNVTNTHFSNCYISSLYAYNQHENTVIDQCYLGYDYSLPKSLNACYKNSYINGFYNQNAPTNLAYFSNCLIYHWCDYYKPDANITYNSSITPYGIYKNCILGYRHYDYNNVSSTSESYWKGFSITPSTQYSVNEYYNNVIYLYPYKYTKNSSGSWSSGYDEDMANKELVIDWSETQSRKNNKASTWAALTNEEGTWWQKLKTDLPFKGDDGKDVGPNGGSGFNINPAIPRIVESTIDSNTDAAGRLNVKIKVELNN